MDNAVIPIQPDHAAVLGKRLAQAFSKDPGCCFLFPQRDARLRKMEWIFTRWLHTLLKCNAAYTTPELAGAALWLPPDRAEAIGLREMAASGFLRALFVLSPREMRRGLRIHLDVLKRTQKHLQEPHWVLDTLGVAPEHHGKGIGRRLVQAGLNRADASKYPCYVITHNLKNVPFYAHLGFDVLESSPIKDTTVVVTSLRRPAAR